MDDTDAVQPQLYLITPPTFELGGFSEQMKALLDAVEIACVRLSMASTDVSEISRAADTLREISHSFDIPLIIDGHAKLVQPLGLDGVHLIDSTKSLRDTRKELGSDAVIGCYCGASRHAGMNAAEMGADYVSFGPITETELGTAEVVANAVFEWWSDMVEIPVVAEGSVTAERTTELRETVDFIALASEVWSSEDPIATAKSYSALLN